MNQTDPGASLVEAGAVLGQRHKRGVTAFPEISPAKRSLDIVVSVTGLLFFLPAMLTIALVLWLREGGPVFFAHERIGHAGRPFKCLKFRTMVPNATDVLEELLAKDPAARAEWESTQKLAKDPRVSCLGHFLRKTSLDELPQFWNVLQGDMSAVGPRPIVADEVRFYRDHIAEYKSVRPGITGNWQVNGRSTTTYAERVAMDVEYVRNPSVWRDLRIMVRTINVVLSRDGAR
ncbi:sugar transferase [Aliiruegeria haliotis]|uniref:sugar transferase n=1 Tax=Aliiruegeria haliotis TaxID=1280846 RepID=UPI001FE41EAD|nr:sugar transferase [Aliiruegeria haliotis]